jgi:hypothetical protein
MNAQTAVNRTAQELLADIKRQSAEDFRSRARYDGHHRRTMHTTLKVLGERRNRRRARLWLQGWTEAWR